MLTRLELSQFKCFSEISLDLAPLTLLSGTNASGKSSILQALVLLHQTAVDNTWSHELVLNGSLLSLGTTTDVLNKVTGRRALSITLSTHSVRCTFVFEGEDRNALSIPLAAVRWSANGEEKTLAIEDGMPLLRLVPVALLSSSPESRELFALAEQIGNLTYVGAERLGPRETYPLGDRSRHRTIGPRGEDVIPFLFWHEEKPVARALILENEFPPTLLSQTQARLRDFFPGASFAVTPVQNANLLALGLRTSDGTSFHRPQHVGYGLTHILPILVAGLAADPGQIVVVENPEVALHPAGQAKMGRFLAEVAAAGVQVILETHSDHVLNGIRLAVHDGRLDPANVRLHFLARQEDGEGLVHEVISPVIDPNGRIDRRPPGFFDEIDRSLRQLVKPARR